MNGRTALTTQLDLLLKPAPIVTALKDGLTLSSLTPTLIGGWLFASKQDGPPNPTIPVRLDAFWSLTTQAPFHRPRPRSAVPAGAALAGQQWPFANTVWIHPFVASSSIYRFVGVVYR